MSSFCAYIRPVVHKRFSPVCKELPELQLSIDSPLDFAAAARVFFDWCGDEREFAAWGNGDLDVLLASCDRFETGPLQYDHFYDLQAAFSALLGIDRQVALYAAVEYCRIPTPFSFHNALHDALYTAMLAERIGKGYNVRPLTPRLRVSEEQTLPEVAFSTHPFVPPPRRRVGPFATLEAGLDARSSRHPTCPICGARQTVLEWYHSNRHQFYAVFECPDHGRFLCRLTMAAGEKGRWRGRLSVPELSAQHLDEFALALRGKRHDCRLSRARRRREEKKAKEKAAGR